MSAALQVAQSIHAEVVSASHRGRGVHVLLQSGADACAEFYRLATDLHASHQRALRFAELGADDAIGDPAVRSAAPRTEVHAQAEAEAEEALQMQRRIESFEHVFLQQPHSGDPPIQDHSALDLKSTGTAARRTRMRHTTASQAASRRSQQPTARKQVLAPAAARPRPGPTCESYPRNRLFANSVAADGHPPLRPLSGAGEELANEQDVHCARQDDQLPGHLPAATTPTETPSCSMTAHFAAPARFVPAGEHDVGALHV